MILRLFTVAIVVFMGIVFWIYSNRRESPVLKWFLRIIAVWFWISSMLTLFGVV